MQLRTFPPKRRNANSSIPRPIERIDSPDGGPLRYRVIQVTLSSHNLVGGASSACVCFHISIHIERTMRTNIDIDDRLIEKALKITGLPTKRAAVEAGLKLLIRMREQAGVRALFGKIPLDLNLQQSRQGRRS
jgi:hypothetical protein